MRILITGASGFIGTHLVETLARTGAEVVALGNHPDKLIPNVEYLGHHLDGVDVKKLGTINAVCHQAANNDTQDHNQEQMFQANVLSVMPLFDKLSKVGCRKFIFASSSAVYGNVPVPWKEDMKPNPLVPYAASKLALEDACRRMFKDRKANWVGLRYVNVYGPGENKKGKRASMIGQILEQMRRRKKPKLFANGEQRRDYVSVWDVCTANVAAINYDGSGIFNIAGGQSWSFNEVVNLLAQSLGVSTEIEYIPNPHEGAYQNHTLCDIGLAFQELAWVPKYDLPSGIKRYIQELKSSQ